MVSAMTALAPGALRSSRYQFILVALLSLNFGIVFFDRNAMNFLMPFVQPELNLSNTQIGMLAGALSLTWAVSSIGVGWLADSVGKRKLLLVVSTICFSLCSFLSGMAGSFALLLGARMLMGVAEGGVAPISHAMVAMEVSPARRGLAQGITNNFGSNLLGSFAAPVLLVAFATSFGWREAFYLAGVPGLVCAVAMWFMLEEPPAPPKQQGTDGGLMQVLRNHNIVWCCLVCSLCVAYVVMCWVFMPLYLTQIKGISPTSMSWLMGSLGISATIGSFVVSGISDKVGRKPVIITVPLLGLLLPLAALYFDGSLWLLAALFFIGWSLLSITPLLMATVPSESVDARLMATAVGVAMAVPDVLGGVVSPFLVGMLADGYGLAAPLWCMLVMAVGASLCGLGIVETAPSKRKA